MKVDLPAWEQVWTGLLPWDGGVGGGSEAAGDGGDREERGD